MNGIRKTTFYETIIVKARGGELLSHIERKLFEVDRT
jgi:hypothetical protein